MTQRVAVAEALAQCLVRERVEIVFGNPGGYFIRVLDAFARAGLRSIEGRHEGAATYMACGYALASGRPGVVYTQSGPGTTNTLTGIASAFMDSVPIVLFASQAPRMFWGNEGHQESTGYSRVVDQLSVFQSCAHQLARPAIVENVIPMFRSCLRAAIGLRGPAVIDLAADLPASEIDFEDLEPQAYRADHGAIDPAGLDRLAALLAEAKQPVLLVGDRLAHRGASATLTAFCERQDLPCATVNYAKGLIAEDHPLSVGIVGCAGHEAAMEYLRTSDLVVVLGARLNAVTTVLHDRELFKRLVHIDADPRDLGRTFPLQLGIVADPVLALEYLENSTRSRAAARGAIQRVSDLKAQFASRDTAAEVCAEQPLSTSMAMRVLREVLPRNVLMVGDTGATAVTLAQHFPVYEPDGYYALYALASMGSGMPLAFGVQAARPSALVCAVIGDGGFLAHVGELSVAVQNELPVIVVVINNGSYESVGARQEQWFGTRYATEIANPDYVQLAQSFGCIGHSVTTAEHLRAALTTSLELRRPTVIEVKVARAVVGKGNPRMDELNQQLFQNASRDWPFPRPAR